jgi:hypothetical protein
MKNHGPPLFLVGSKSAWDLFVFKISDLYKESIG